MNCLRLSGSARPETCSADTVVPRITKMSTPASTTALAYRAVRCGDRLAAAVTPARAISSILRPMRSSEIGSAYMACSRRVAACSSSSVTSASSGSGFSYRVHSPSRSSTARPPSRPIWMAVAGDTTLSIGQAISGSSNR